MFRPLIPAQAGIQKGPAAPLQKQLGPRFRGDKRRNADTLFAARHALSSLSTEGKHECALRLFHYPAHASFGAPASVPVSPITQLRPADLAR